MRWVLFTLKRLLRQEQNFGVRHSKLTGDPKYAASAKFADERIPQLKEAIQILECHTHPKPTRTKAVSIDRKQLNLFERWQQ